MLVGAGTVLTSRAGARGRGRGRRASPSRPGRTTRSSPPARELGLPFFPGSRRRPSSGTRCGSAAGSSRSSPPRRSAGRRSSAPSSATFPQARFIPTGGDGRRARSRRIWLVPSVLACGGSWICEAAPASRTGRVDEIARRAARGGGGWPRDAAAAAPAARGVPLRPRLARRGDAAARSRRGSHRDHAHVPRRGREAASTTSRAGFAAASACATGDRDRARRQPGRPADRGPDAAGRRRRTRSLVWRAYDGIGRERAQRPQLHRARLRRPRCRRLLRPRDTPPPRSCGRATSTGSAIFGAEGVRWFHTGGVFARPLGDDRAPSRWKRSRRPAGTGRSSPTT